MVYGGLCDDPDPEFGSHVVLCERGDISFAEKVLNVQSSGGTAAIIYNNIPGSFSGTMGEDSADIIALSLSQEDGQYLVNYKLDSQAFLYGHIDLPASGYEAWDGTSMATPHVAGVAALIWSAHPDLTNDEIRNAMAATALDLGDLDRDIYFGYGLVQAADAIDYLGGEPVNQSPTVDISSPANGTSFDSGTTIAFSGTADDFEDGDLSAALVWTANGVVIGNGGTFSTQLDDGDYTITAMVEDAGGKTGNASVTISVGDLANEHPIVSIQSPTDGSNYRTDDPITFAGTAIDDNDGDLSASLIWVSDLDGEIGTGTEFSTNLNEGTHTITASATDMDGETGSDSVEIIVVEETQESFIRVGAIDMSYTRRGRNYTIYTMVTILDVDQNLVSGATVTLNTNGTITSGVTGLDGTVTLSISTRNTGLFTSTVTNVTHPTFEYDSEANEETSETLQVP